MNTDDSSTRTHFLFDAYGTLFDVHSAVNGHASALGGQAAAVSDLWRERQLQYTWVRTLAGSYEDFQKLTEDALDHALEAHDLHDGILRERLLSAYRELAAYADVAPALRQVRERGAATAVFSNATRAMLEEALGHAGLVPLVDGVISVDPIATYKPADAAYALAERECGIAAEQVRFFSSNAWDVHGARCHGWQAYWVNRGGKPAEYGIGAGMTFPSLQQAVDHALDA